MGLILWMIKFKIIFYLCEGFKMYADNLSSDLEAAKKIGFVFRSFRNLMRTTIDIFGWEMLRCVPLIKTRLVLSCVTRFIAASIYHSESRSLHSLSIFKIMN